MYISLDGGHICVQLGFNPLETGVCGDTSIESFVHDPHLTGISNKKTCLQDFSVA